MRILVVDNDPPILAACLEVLANAGYEVEGFGRGELALEALADDCPDLLVVGAELPGIDGVEVARRARRLQPRLPILMITRDAPAIAGTALGAGVLQVIATPFAATELLAAVTSSLR